MSLVLVVDDEPADREYVTGLLELEGHDVVAAADGPSALRSITQTRPDCVLLDLTLPGMSGQEVLAEIRRIDGGPYLPVVMLTAAASHDQAWRAWNAGVDYFLTKPFEADRLIGIVQYLAAGQHG
jgi:two-component system, OmpR family, response regulator ResD